MRHKFQFLLCIAFCLLATSCNHSSINDLPTDDCPYSDFFGCCHGFETGDLIFVADTSGMGSAIYQSTGAYTHVAVVVCEDSGCYIYEAIPSAGVIRTQYDEWAEQILSLLPDTNMSFLDIAHLMQFVCDYDTALLVQRLHENLGKPYDPYFLPNNDRFYCSELVYESFYDKSGKRLFEAKPMNFKSSDGTYPAYWVHHFDSLGVAIPQGISGTNPTNLHNSTCLMPLKIE